MAQVKKAAVRARILAAAREVFLEEGFQGASLRAIAERAGCSLSNLYSYFRGKDALFEALVRPCMDAAIVILREQRKVQPPPGEVIMPAAQEWARFLIAIDFMEEHREDLRLLLLKSEGSSVHGFRDMVIEEYKAIWFAYADHLRRNFPESAVHELSEFFVHSIATFYFNVMAEFVHRDFEYAEMKRHTADLFRYAQHGLAGLLQGGDEL